MHSRRLSIDIWEKRVKRNRMRANRRGTGRSTTRLVASGKQAGGFSAVRSESASTRVPRGWRRAVGGDSLGQVEFAEAPQSAHGRRDALQAVVIQVQNLQGIPQERRQVHGTRRWPVTSDKAGVVGPGPGPGRGGRERARGPTWLRIFFAPRGQEGKFSGLWPFFAPTGRQADQFFSK